MTMEPNAEYSLPTERALAGYLKLADEHLKEIEYARLEVESREDPENALKEVARLNRNLLEAKIVGKSVRLQSPFIFVGTQSFGEESHDPQFVVDVSSEKDAVYEGIFMGCKAVDTTPSYAELVYVLELPLDDEGLTFQTITAPVDASDLSVAVSAFSSEMYNTSVVEAFDFLDELGNTSVQNEIRFLKELIETNPDAEAEFVRKAALVAMNILASPAVGETEEARRAVTTILESLVYDGVSYAIDGAEVNLVKNSDGLNTIGLAPVRSVIGIHGVSLIKDFKYEKGIGLEILDALQPAFIALDEYGIERILPLRYLKTFSEYEDIVGYGDPFLEKYPDIFNPDAEHSPRLKHIEKYLKKHDTPVKKYRRTV